MGFSRKTGVHPVLRDRRGFLCRSTLGAALFTYYASTNKSGAFLGVVSMCGLYYLGGVRNVRDPLNLSHRKDLEGERRELGVFTQKQGEQGKQSLGWNNVT